MASLRKKIDRQIRNMPKYSIQDEAFETQSIARSRAFGKDRGIQMQQEDLEQSTADAVSQAQQVSTSTSDVLGTIAAINANKTQGQRSIAELEAGIQRQNVGDLYQANQLLIDEKDKAWMQNVYAPWDAKLRNLQQRKASRTAFWSNLTGGLLGAAGAIFGGPLGGAIGSGVGKSVANAGQATAAQQSPYSMYGYNPNMPFS